MCVDCRKSLSLQQQSAEMESPFKLSQDFDPTNPLSIYEYSRHLIGNSLHSLLGDEVAERARKGKGGLGQMVEELFFGYCFN